MSNENHNNWKLKLEELDNLQGETFQDKNASWEKLYARMREKKRSKKAAWYWAAAACILFALMIPVMIFNKKTHQVANVEIKQKPPETKTSVATIIDKKDSIKNISPVLPEKNEIRVADRFNKTENKIIAGKEINKLRIYDTVSMQNLVAGTADNPIKTVDTATYLTATIPVKKKLPVVNINELDDPANVPEEVARNSDKRSFLFLKLASQEVYSSSSAPATKDFATINLKTPSN